MLLAKDVRYARDPTQGEREKFSQWMKRIFPTNQNYEKFLSMLENALSERTSCRQNGYIWFGTGNNGKTSVRTLVKATFPDLFVAIEYDQWRLANTVFTETNIQTPDRIDDTLFFETVFDVASSDSNLQSEIPTFKYALREALLHHIMQDV